MAPQKTSALRSPASIQKAQRRRLNRPTSSSSTSSTSSSSGPKTLLSAFKAKNLTFSAIAEKLHRPTATIAALFSGQAPASALDIKNLADLFGIPYTAVQDQLSSAALRAEISAAEATTTTTKATTTTEGRKTPQTEIVSFSDLFPTTTKRHRIVHREHVPTNSRGRITKAKKKAPATTTAATKTEEPVQPREPSFPGARPYYSGDSAAHSDTTRIWGMMQAARKMGDGNLKVKDLE